MIPACGPTQANNPNALCSNGPINFWWPGATSKYQALLVKVFAGTAAGATVAAYSVGQQIAIAVVSLGVGFGALFFVFGFRSFRDVAAAGRAQRSEAGAGG